MINNNNNNNIPTFAMGYSDEEYTNNILPVLKNSQNLDRISNIANKRLGFCGWSFEVKSLTQQLLPGSLVVWTAKVRVTLKGGCYRDAVGFGEVKLQTTWMEAARIGRHMAIEDATLYAFQEFGFDFTHDNESSTQNIANNNNMNNEQTYQSSENNNNTNNNNNSVQFVYPPAVQRKSPNNNNIKQNVHTDNRKSFISEPKPLSPSSIPNHKLKHITTDNNASKTNNTTNNVTTNNKNNTPNKQHITNNNNYKNFNSDHPRKPMITPVSPPLPLPPQQRQYQHNNNNNNRNNNNNDNNNSNTNNSIEDNNKYLPFNQPNNGYKSPPTNYSNNNSNNRYKSPIKTSPNKKKHELSPNKLHKPPLNMIPVDNISNMKNHVNTATNHPQSTLDQNTTIHNNINTRATSNVLNNGTHMQSNKDSPNNNPLNNNKRSNNVDDEIAASLLAFQESENLDLGDAQIDLENELKELERTKHNMYNKKRGIIRNDIKKDDIKRYRRTTIRARNIVD